MFYIVQQILSIVSIRSPITRVETKLNKALQELNTNNPHKQPHSQYNNHHSCRPSLPHAPHLSISNRHPQCQHSKSFHCHVFGESKVRGEGRKFKKIIVTVYIEDVYIL